MSRKTQNSQKPSVRSYLTRLICVMMTLSLLFTGLTACKNDDATPVDGDATKSAKGDKLGNEELIRARINAFAKAYNEGDMEKVLECLDAKSRNAMQAMLDLLGGVASKYAGFTIDLKDLFSLGVSITADDFMGLEIQSIVIDDAKKTASVKTSMRLENQTATIYFDMVHEDDDWFIKNMTDSSSYSTTGYYTDTDAATDTQAPEAISIDPFDGIEYVVTGISPYCEISINNGNCDVNVQENVTYSLDKEKYANGETAVITAKLETGWGYEDNKYTLTNTTGKFTVKNQPEYITSLDSLDLSLLESEERDYFESKCSEALGSGSHGFLFGNNVNSWKNIENINSSLQEKYFSSLKLMKTDSKDYDTPFNRLSFVYKINISAKGDFIHYVNISAWNIVKYPDGSIKWGSESVDDFDFHYNAYTSNMEECIANTITAYKADFNIKKLEPTSAETETSSAF